MPSTGQAVHQRHVTIQAGAFPFSVTIEGADVGDPEEFARRLRGPILARIADALERQRALGAGDGMGL